MKKITFILLTLLAIQRSSAQYPGLSKEFILTGIVTDSSGAPLYPATVIYSSGMDSLERLTTPQGAYRFTSAKDSSFTLFITMKGYMPYRKAYHLNTIRVTEHLSPIRLARSYGDLDPVIISAIRPVTMAQDTLTFHVAAFPTRAGSEVEDVLKILPGVEVDLNGHVIVQGKTIDHVMVNGKDFFGGDVLLAIRNFPADVVDKLQVIDDYGDKARLTGVRSGDPAKILNIVLRSDRRNGAFGRFNGTLGNQNKCALGAFVNAFDGERQASVRGSITNNNPLGSDLSKTVGVDFANKWSSRWSTTTNFHTNSNDPIIQTQITSLSVYPKDTLLQTQGSKNNQHQNQSSFSSRLTCTPDLYTMARLSATGNSTLSRSLQDIQYSTTQTDSGYKKTSQGRSSIETSTSGQSFNANIYFEKKLPHARSRYTLEGALDFNNTTSVSDNQTTATIQTPDSASTSFLHSRITTHTPSTSTDLAATYFLPFGTHGFLEFGYRINSTISRTTPHTQIADTPSAFLPTIDSLSLPSSLRTLSQNGHVGYRAHFPSIDVGVNLDAQSGQMRGTANPKADEITYRYFSLVPQAQLAWTANKTDRVNLYYAAGPQLPTLQQIAPFTNLINPQYPTIGNPHLTQAYTHNVSIDFEHSRQNAFQYFGYGMVLNYVLTEHPITSNLTNPKNNNAVIQETTYENTRPAHLFSLNYHLTLPTLLNRRIKVMLSGAITRNQSITLTDSLPYPTISWTNATTLQLQYLLPNRISVDLAGTYSDTKTIYPGTASGVQRSRTALVSLDSYHYFGRKSIFHYSFQQPYSSEGSRLQTIPPSLTATLQRQFLSRNQITLTVAGFNLLGQKTTTSETVSAATLTQTTPELTGRYFQVSFLWKPQHFPQSNQTK